MASSNNGDNNPPLPDDDDDVNNDDSDDGTLQEPVDEHEPVETDDAQGRADVEQNAGSLGEVQSDGLDERGPNSEEIGKVEDAESGAEKQNLDTLVLELFKEVAKTHDEVLRTVEIEPDTDWIHPFRANLKNDSEEREGIWRPIEGVLRTVQARIAARGTVAVLKDHISSLESQIANQEQTVKSLGEEIEQVRAQEGATSEEIAALIRQQEELQKLIDQNHDDQKSAEQKVSDLEADIEKTSGALKQISEKALALIENLQLPPKKTAALRTYFENLDAREELELELNGEFQAAVIQALDKLKERRNSGSDDATRVREELSALSKTLQDLDNQRIGVERSTEDARALADQFAQQRAVQEEQAGNGRDLIDGFQTLLNRVNNAVEPATQDEELEKKMNTLEGVLGRTLSPEQLTDLRELMGQGSGAAVEIVKFLKNTILKDGYTVRLYIDMNPIAMKGGDDDEVLRDAVASALEGLGDVEPVGHAIAFSPKAMMEYLQENAKAGVRVFVRWASTSETSRYDLEQDGVPPEVEERKDDVLYVVCVPIETSTQEPPAEEEAVS